MQASRSEQRLDTAVVRDHVTLEEALQHMQCEAVLVVDDRGRLAGLVTDGDLRRAFVRGADRQTPVHQVMTPDPVTASPDTPRAELRALMLARRIRHVPVIDDAGRPVALELLKDQELDQEMAAAVVMAGGMGTRLRPLTNDCPKPLLAVGESTILDTVLDGLGQSGIEDVVITVNYLRERIKAHVGNGDAHALNVRYVEEQQRMGTAGSLPLLEPRPQSSFLVMNGDLVTELDYAALLRFHRRHDHAVSVCVRREAFEIPYGVVQLDGDSMITGLEEKPRQKVFVNAGIYVLEPDVIDLIPTDQPHYDMTTLIQAAVDRGMPVGAFPIVEYWRDIGQHDQMNAAREEWQARRRKRSGILSSVPAHVF